MQKLYKIIGISCIVLFVLFFIYAINSSPKFNKATIPDEEWIKIYGKAYYGTQNSYYDIQSKAYGVSSDKMNPTTTVAEAEKTMRLCLSQIGKERCEGIVAGDTYIGEPKFWVIMTIGNHTSSRNTTTMNGVVREQWVYGDPLYGATYMYFDNDVLTAVQNTSH